MPVLGNEPAVMNLTVHPGAVRGPDGDAVHFDVLHGAAALAGVVGVVSLTEARSATLIGVLISVTTIPAASDIGVSLAFGSGSEAWGSVVFGRQSHLVRVTAQRRWGRYDAIV